MPIIKNAIEVLESKLPPERVARARRKAEQTLFTLRLNELRKQLRLRQIDVTSFSQSALSKLEKRSDMKLSILIEYLKSMGCDVEIKVYPREKRKGVPDEFTLLKA